MSGPVEEEATERGEGESEEEGDVADGDEGEESEADEEEEVTRAKLGFGEDEEGEEKEKDDGGFGAVFEDERSVFGDVALRGALHDFKDGGVTDASRSEEPDGERSEEGEEEAFDGSLFVGGERMEFLSERGEEGAIFDEAGVFEEFLEDEFGSEGEEEDKEEGPDGGVGDGDEPREEGEEAEVFFVLGFEKAGEEEELPDEDGVSEDVGASGDEICD